jgi:hypothetical protein
MVAGEAWAVRQCGFLVGYYLACPFCGRVNVLLADEQQFHERGQIPSLVLSFGPGHVCTQCRRGFRVVDGRFAEVGNG